MGPFTSTQALALDRALKASRGVSWQRATMLDAYDAVQRSSLALEEKAPLLRALGEIEGYLLGIEEALHLSEKGVQPW
jgi:hypothetical protein